MMWECVSVCVCACVFVGMCVGLCEYVGACVYDVGMRKCECVRV